MPKVPYPYEVNGKLVAGKGSLIPICSLSNRSLLPSLTVFPLSKNFRLYYFAQVAKGQIQNKESSFEHPLVNVSLAVWLFFSILVETAHQFYRFCFFWDPWAGLSGVALILFKSSVCKPFQTSSVEDYIFLTFTVGFWIPIIFSNLDLNCSNFLDLKNL